MINPDFILFGQGNYNTLGVLHELSELNVSPLILSVGNPRDIADGNIIGFSKFAKNIVVVDSDKDGLEWIIEHQTDFQVGTIIYPTADSVEHLLDCNYNLLRERFRFPNAGAQGAVARLMDKHLQTDLARQSGIRVLESQYSNNPGFSFDTVRYPCMVKPLNSTEGSKGDMKVCENEQELRTALANGRHTKDFIVQQYIENEADLLFLGVAFSNGEVWIPAVVIKPGVSKTGEYTHAVISTEVDKHLPEKKAVIRFVRETGYTGPFSIEFGLERGKNYFFEINLRNDGTSHYPLAAGVNIAGAYIADHPAASITPINYEMIDEVGDIRRVLYKELTLTKWLSSFRNAGAYRFYHKGDRGLVYPLSRMFLSRFTDKFFRIVKR